MALHRGNDKTHVMCVTDFYQRLVDLRTHTRAYRVY